MDLASIDEIQDANTLGIRFSSIPNPKPVKKKLSLTRSLINPLKEHY